MYIYISACLTCPRLWIQCPAEREGKGEEKEEEEGREGGEERGVTRTWEGNRREKDWKEEITGPGAAERTHMNSDAL